MKATKYQNAYEILRAEILGGKYSSRLAFPSVTAASRRFGISRLTAVKVFDKLKGEGLVCARSGAGTFVTRQGALRKIGLILPGLVSYSEYFQPIVNEITHLARAEGFELCLGNVSAQEVKARTHEVRELAASFIRSKVAGVIYQPLEYLDGADAVNVRILSVFDRAKVPVVLLDSDVLPPPASSSHDVVTIDNVDAGERLANHLFDRGAKEVRFFRLPEMLPTVAKRMRGVMCAAVLRGRKWTAESVLAAQPDDKAAIRRYLRRRPRPDAFVCENDTVAAVLLRTLTELKVKVPDDVMLAGFDDVQHARLTTPSLTTVRQPCAKIAETAFRRLVSRIARPDLLPVCIALPAPLVVRESTAAARRSSGSLRRQGIGKS